MNHDCVAGEVDAETNGGGGVSPATIGFRPYHS